jgi:two-component system, cell cycle response regulator
MDPLATTVLYIGHDSKASALRAALETASRGTTQKFALAHAPVDTPDGLERLAAGGVDIVLVDAAASLEGAMDALVRARIEAPDVPVVVLADGAGAEAAGALAVEAGAQDWIAREPLDGALLGRVMRYAIERERLQATLRQLALTDELTGLYNRRGFLTLADHHLRLAPRTRGLLLASLEVPGLRDVNEKHGREAGDRLLLAAAAALRDTFRASDVIARIGGGEFAVLVFDAADETEDVIAPRLRARVKRHNADHKDAPVPLALLLGIARFDSAAPPIAADLLARAATKRAAS